MKKIDITTSTRKENAEINELTVQVNRPESVDEYKKVLGEESAKALLDFAFALKFQAAVRVKMEAEGADPRKIQTEMADWKFTPGAQREGKWERMAKEDPEKLKKEFARLEALRKKIG